MDAGFAPAKERLARAETILLRAVKQGAQLMTLSELFNTGYVYSDAEYGYPRSGTVWMSRGLGEIGFDLGAQAAHGLGQAATPVGGC